MPCSGVAEPPVIFLKKQKPSAMVLMCGGGAGALATPGASEMLQWHQRQRVRQQRQQRVRQQRRVRTLK